MRRFCNSGAVIISLMALTTTTSAPVGGSGDDGGSTRRHLRRARGDQRLHHIPVLIGVEPFDRSAFGFRYSRAPDD
jgi:hypothetical protein